MSEYGLSSQFPRDQLPNPIPPLVGYVPPGEIDERTAWLLALRLTPDRTWECLIVVTRRSPPLNGHPEGHTQLIGWVPRERVRKLTGFLRDYDRVPRLRGHS